MLNRLKRNLGIVAWLFFGLVIAYSFQQIDDSRAQSRKQSCLSQLNSALTLRDLIDYSFADSPSPRAQQIARKFYARIELPPPICKDTDVDTVEFFRRDKNLPGTEQSETNK